MGAQIFRIDNADERIATARTSGRRAPDRVHHGGVRDGLDARAQPRAGDRRLQRPQTRGPQQDADPRETQHQSGPAVAVCRRGFRARAGSSVWHHAPPVRSGPGAGDIGTRQGAHRVAGIRSVWVGKGAFTCPPGKAGSAFNPSACTGDSADVITMRYAGTEFQLSHPMPGMPRLTPHVAAGFNVIDGIFQMNAQRKTEIDHTKLWTRGTTFSATAGLSYLLTERMGITVDAFYSPLSIQRQVTGPRQNDGLFNVRALLSYRAR